MILARQTYEGLQITAKSTNEMAHHFISKGTPYVLTEHVDQDVAEEYFMSQRSLGRRSDNPVTLLDMLIVVGYIRSDAQFITIYYVQAST